MNETTELREVRTILFTPAEFEIFKTDFKVLCALRGQTVSQSLAKLVTDEVARQTAKFKLADQFVLQPDLLTALEKNGISVTRQTLLSHRENGKLPGEYYVETTTSDTDSRAPSKSNRRIFYRLQPCIEFYARLFNKENKQNDRRKTTGTTTAANAGTD